LVTLFRRDADAPWWQFWQHLTNPPCLELLLLAVEVADPLSLSPRPSITSSVDPYFSRHFPFQTASSSTISLSLYFVVKIVFLATYGGGLPLPSSEFPPGSEWLPCTRVSIIRLQTAHWAECIRSPPPHDVDERLDFTRGKHCYVLCILYSSSFLNARRVQYLKHWQKLFITYTAKGCVRYLSCVTFYFLINI